MRRGWVIMVCGNECEGPEEDSEERERQWGERDETKGYGSEGAGEERGEREADGH